MIIRHLKLQDQKFKMSSDLEAIAQKLFLHDWSEEEEAAVEHRDSGTIHGKDQFYLIPAFLDF